MHIYLFFVLNAFIYVDVQYVTMYSIGLPIQKVAL